MTTSEFISRNLMGDIRQLALQSSRYPDVDMPYALNQIQGWQTARHKLPMLSANEGIIYPPHLSMEQCSSESTAMYKRSVVTSCLASIRAISPTMPDDTCGATSMADLTGGFGVDFMYLSGLFGRSLYVERNSNLCDVARHNFGVMRMESSQVVCAAAEQVLATLPRQTMVYLDPARRDAHGARTFAIADCTPDVCELLPTLLRKSLFVMLKLSPMLDWHKALLDLQGSVRQVHIVSVDGECKELLLVLSSTLFADDDVMISCADLQSRPAPSSASPATTFCYTLSDANDISSMSAPPQAYAPPFYLYEPSASIMKAGCFGQIERAYGIRCLSANSHLLVSDRRVDDFPGRRFVVDGVSSLNRKALRSALLGIDRANVAVRNFPMSVAELRKRLKLRDGGDVYIFASTDASGEHLLYVCHKM